MLRIARMTDYAFILLTRLVQEEEGEVVPCSTLAEQVPLPLPTVRKVCKRLSQEGLLVSHQGAHGGYELARDAAEISVAEIVEAMEGPIALTLCSEGEDACEIQPACPVDHNWQVINEAIRETLAHLTLADMDGSLSQGALAQVHGASDPTKPSPTPAATDAASGAAQATERRSDPR